MPALARRMSSGVAEMGAATAKLAITLPDSMKSIAEEGVRALARRSPRLTPQSRAAPPHLPSHTIFSPPPLRPPPSVLPHLHTACPRLVPRVAPCLRPPRSRAQPVIAKEVAAIYAAQPALMAAVEAKIAEADKPGVRATVAAAKSPGACKYTEEGSIVDAMLKQVAMSERRMKSLASLEYTLTASDKEELLKAYAAKAAEQGADVKFTLDMAPDKITLG